MMYRSKRSQPMHSTTVWSALLFAIAIAAGTPALAASCSDYGHYLPIVGSVALPATPLALALQGDFVYAAMGNSGLRIIDVSNPIAPIVIGSVDTPGNATDVAVLGGYAYVADGAPGLHVIDVSDLAAPVIVGTANTPGVCTDVAVQGPFTYVADGASGVQVIDVSNPVAPIGIGNVSMPGTLPPPGARNIAAQGPYVYAVDSSAMHVIEVSNPGAPVIVGATVGPCFGCYGVAVDDSLAYVLGGADGRQFQIVDVRVPSSPTILTEAPLVLGGGTEVSISFPFAYVMRGMTLVAYKIDDALSTQIAGLRDMQEIRDRTSTPIAGQGDLSPAAGSSSVGVVSDGEFIYAGGFSAGAQSRLHVISAASPQKQPFGGFADTPGAAMNVVLSGHHAYVADGPAGGLQVIDVSDRTNPVIVGALDTPGSANDVAVSGSLACVADGSAGLQVVDVSDPTSPMILGNLPLTTNSVGMLGAFAYILSGGALHAVDLSKPAAPTLRGSAGTRLFTTGPVEISNRHAFVFGWEQFNPNEIQAIDLSDPAAPQLADNLPVGESALDLSVDGDRAYFVEIHASFRVIDVSNPLNLQVIAGTHYNLPTAARRVTGRGGHAYIACLGLSGLRVLDVSAPPALSIIGNAAIPFDEPTGIAADDAIVCVSVPNVGLFVFPAQCPSPTSIGELPAGDHAAPRFQVGRNPAHGIAILELDLQQASDLRLQVFDIAGRRVRALLAGRRPAGHSRIVWDGHDERGQRVANGVYVVRLETAGAATTRRLTLLR